MTFELQRQKQSTIPIEWFTAVPMAWGTQIPRRVSHCLFYQPTAMSRCLDQTAVIAPLQAASQGHAPAGRDSCIDALPPSRPLKGPENGNCKNAGTGFSTQPHILTNTLADAA